MKAYISLGSNVGDREMYLNKAIELLYPSVNRISEIIETDPVGMETKDKFLNAIAEIDTDLEPIELLDFLEGIEKQLGRTEKGNYKPRVIDLDILFYEDLKMDTSRLKIPHPKFEERDFLCKLYKQLKT